MPALRVIAALALAAGFVLSAAPAQAAPASTAAEPGCAAMTGHVVITESDSVFLADRSALPLRIDNQLSSAVTVTATVHASNPRLAIDDSSIEVTVPAKSQVSVSFAATAVSNGRVDIVAALFGASGCLLGAPTIATVDVQAGWETPIVAAAGGLLLLVIVVGVIRTVRRVRRAAAAEPSDD